ncbi:hypothetical protein V6N12_004585 [Hibiscus sabdariffa]|uniref:ACT domain-containing protein ACR n=1 Tax=Hibiscus sabdariffa TaxID=183260 RepID=A0ABR2CLW3_9ROSI
MGVPTDDAVLIQKGKKPGDPHVITVNCPDKHGLGCDFCHIILDFGLYITKGDVTQVLSELELSIQKVKVTTTPDGRVLDLFFITDNIPLICSSFSNIFISTSEVRSGMEKGLLRGQLARGFCQALKQYV